MRIYLSGPMTGLPENNFPAFNSYAATLRARGFEVVNPAEIDPGIPEPPPDAPEWKAFYLACLRLDVKALCDCQCLALLPGWERSSGAHIELHIAHRLGLNVSMVDELLRKEPTAPIDMVLHCPACGFQHVDRPGMSGQYGDPEWGNPPHRSHLCAYCGHVWRPADVPTNGVFETATAGRNDSPRVPSLLYLGNDLGRHRG